MKQRAIEMMNKKTCFKCGETKQVEMFHKHPGMKDGRLNKCSSCVVNDVRIWREKRGKQEDCRKRYERELELGSRTRKRTREEVASYKVSEDAKLDRRASSLKYFYKRRSNIASSKISELDEFVISEAIKLRVLREKHLGIKWHVDHIVPINAKNACGLHNANNIQVVPARWNMQKCNRTMDTFFPTKWKQCGV